MNEDIFGRPWLLTLCKKCNGEGFIPKFEDPDRVLCEECKGIGEIKVKEL